MKSTFRIIAGGLLLLSLCACDRDSDGRDSDNNCRRSPMSGMAGGRGFGGMSGGSMMGGGMGMGMGGSGRNGFGMGGSGMNGYGGQDMSMNGDDTNPCRSGRGDNMPHGSVAIGAGG